MRPVAAVELQVRAKARSRCYFCLLLPSLGAAVASAGLAAQAGGHPHVAPLGPIDADAVFCTVVNGWLGGYNSIVIATLDASPPGGDEPHAYIGSSGGVRRFDSQ